MLIDRSNGNKRPKYLDYTKMKVQAIEDLKKWSNEESKAEKDEQENLAKQEEIQKAEEAEIDLLGMSPPAKISQEPTSEPKSQKTRTLPPPPGFKPVGNQQSTSTVKEPEVIDLLGGEVVKQAENEVKPISNNDLFSLDLVS
jgi:long-subunit acyl-CoA synthetase (AMP-forming)